MTTRRYASTTVRDKKNLQRTLNTFSEQYDFAAYEITDESAHLCYFFDNLSAYKSEMIVFSKGNALQDLEDTEKLLMANKDMFEHKFYQPFLEQIIKKFHQFKEINGKTVTVNVFFKKDKDTVLALMHDHLEKLSGKQLTERFVSKLYTTLKNRVLFPKLYFSDYLSSKNNKILTIHNALESIFKQHYNFYKEHKWILNEKENFQYYYWQIEEEPHNPIVLEWYSFMEFLHEHKIEKCLLESVKFIGEWIDPFIPYQFTEDYSKPLRKYSDGTIFCFLNDKKKLHGIKLKMYLDEIEYKEAKNYRQIGKIHSIINKFIPKDDQLTIHKLYEIIIGNDYESVLDFSDASRQTFTPSEYDEYYYAKYGDYPERDEHEENEQSEEKDEDESDEASSDPKTYFPYDNTTSDECPFGDIEEKKIEIPSKKRDNVPPPVDYGDDEIPF